MGSTTDVIKGTISGGMETMGTFNIELTDFMRHYTQLTGLSKEANAEFAKISQHSRDLSTAPITKAEMGGYKPLESEIKETHKEWEQVRRARIAERRRAADVMLNDPPCKWPGKGKDAMNVLRSDIETQMDIVEEQLSKGNKSAELLKKKEYLDKMSDLLDMSLNVKENLKGHIKEAKAGPGL